MVGGKTQNLHSVQHDEFRFILHNVISPSTGHLGNTVDASNENHGKCREYRAHEQLESHARDEVDDRLAPFASSGKRPIEVFAAQDGENQQSEYLKDDTGHHQVVAGGCTRVSVSGCGYSSARTLEDQGKQVAKDKNPGVVLGGQTRVLASDCQDNMFQSKIDCCREESLGRVSDDDDEVHKKLGGCEPVQ